MQTIINSMCFLNHDWRERGVPSVSQSVASILLSSSNCIGNDGTPCAALHSSLAPRLLTLTYDFKLQHLLIKSHNIGWSNRINFCGDEESCRPICDVLSKTKYSARSIREIGIYNAPNVVPWCVRTFIRNHCQVLETLSIGCDYSATDLLIPRYFVMSSPLDIICENKYLPSTLLECNLKHGFSVCDDDLRALSKCSSLRKLKMRCFEKNHLTVEGGINHLEKLKELREISISRLFSTRSPSVPNALLTCLSKLPQLRLFSLTSSYPISSTGLRALIHTASPFLHTIDLSDCGSTSDVTTHLFRELADPKTSTLSQSITSLDLSDFDIRDEDSIAELGKLPLLREMKLMCCGRQLTDSALEKFCNGACNTTLEKLTVSANVALTYAGIEHVGLLTNLRELNMCYMGNDDSVGGGGEPLFRHLASSPHLAFTLKKLIMTHNDGIDDASLFYVSQLSELEDLQLAACEQISDVGISHFLDHSNQRPKCPNMKKLGLSFCALLSDKSIEIITKAFPVIEELDVNSCDKISRRAIKKFRDHHRHRYLVDVQKPQTLLRIAEDATNFLLNAAWKNKEKVLPVVTVILGVVYYVMFGN